MKSSNRSFKKHRKTNVRKTKYGRRSSLRKMKGGTQVLETAQFPNVYNTIGYNVNLGNPNTDPSDSANQVSSRLLTGGSKGYHKSKTTKNKKTMNKNMMKGGKSQLSTDAFLGPAYNMNAPTAFGTSAGAFWSANKIAGTPMSGPDNFYSYAKSPMV